MKRKSSYERFKSDGDGTENWLMRTVTDKSNEPDQRRSNRRPIPMVVTLGQCLSCLGKWPVRNLSLGGAFLEGSLDRMHVGALLDVAFRYAPKGVAVMRYVPARVVRVEPDGVAVKFGKYGQMVHADLMTLLRPM